MAVSPVNSPRRVRLEFRQRRHAEAAHIRGRPIGHQAGFRVTGRHGEIRDHAVGVAPRRYRHRGRSAGPRRRPGRLLSARRALISRVSARMSSRSGPAAPMPSSPSRITDGPRIEMLAARTDRRFGGIESGEVFGSQLRELRRRPSPADATRFPSPPSPDAAPPPRHRRHYGPCRNRRSRRRVAARIGKPPGRSGVRPPPSASPRVTPAAKVCSSMRRISAQETMGSFIQMNSRETLHPALADDRRGEQIRDALPRRRARDERRVPGVGQKSGLDEDRGILRLADDEKAACADAAAGAPATPGRSSNSTPRPASRSAGV